MTAVQLETPVEGQFLQITPEKKLRFTGGAWRLHTNNLPVSEVAPIPALPPVRSEEAPALPSKNPFWQKPSSNQLYYQHKDADNVVAWKPVQNTDRYDLSVVTTTSVLDFAVNQVFKVDNTTASVKSLVVQNAPAGRAITVPVIIMGKVGTVNFPAGVTWDQNKVPTLSDTKTTIIFLWDGTSLTGSKGHSY